MIYLFCQAAIASPGDSDAVARAVVNTILGGCSGGLTVLFTNKFLLGAKWSYLMTLNGTLTGKTEKATYISFDFLQSGFSTLSCRFENDEFELVLAKASRSTSSRVSSQK